MNKLLGITLEDIEGGDTIYIMNNNVPIQALSDLVDIQVQTGQQNIQNMQQTQNNQTQQIEQEDSKNPENDAEIDEELNKNDDDGMAGLKAQLIDKITKDIKRQLKIKRLKSKLSNLDKNKYIEQFHLKTEKQEIQVRKVWAKVFQTQMDAVLTTLNSSKSINITKDLKADIVKALNSAMSLDEIKQLVMPLLKQYLNEHGKDMLKLLESDVDFSLHDEEVTKWLDKYCGDNIKAIQETTQNQLTEELIEGEQNGESIPHLMDRVRDVMGDMEGYRAERIARTEVIGASNQGKLMGMQSSGVVEYKEWLTSIDGRERDWHKDANGQRVKIDDYFSVHSESMTGPGDPSAGADNVINCRCTVLPFFPEDGDDGGYYLDANS